MGLFRPNRTRLVEEFKIAKNDVYYKEFLKTNRVIGVWDDHDYGTNNGDKTFKHKDMM